MLGLKIKVKVKGFNLLVKRTNLAQISCILMDISTKQGFQ